VGGPDPGSECADAGAPPAAAKAEKKDERVVIEWVDVLNQEGDVYHLRGNVVFAREDMKVYCDEADYDEKADTAKARGNLRITDPNSVITGDLIDVDFNKEFALVTGSVTIVTQKNGQKPEVSLEKPGKDGATGKGNGANPPLPGAAAVVADKPKDDQAPKHVEDYWEKKSTITCERLEYYYADDVKKMVATPRVKAVQEDKTAWADTAVYEDIPRLITLTGNVVLTTEKGDEMRCAKAVIWVDEDRIEAQGASGVTLRKKKGEEPKNPPAPPKPAEQPTTPAPATAPEPAQTP
jgi:lipopolysaccharide assembly outer membrane protein LptD (OstA)